MIIDFWCKFQFNSSCGYQKRGSPVGIFQQMTFHVKHLTLFFNEEVVSIKKCYLPLLFRDSFTKVSSVFILLSTCRIITVSNPISDLSSVLDGLRLLYLGYPMHLSTTSSSKSRNTTFIIVY